MVNMHNSCLMLQSSNSVVFSVYTTLSDNTIQQKAKLINVNMESVSKIEDLEFTGAEWDHVCIFIGNGDDDLLLSVVYSMITRAVKSVIIYTENAKVCNVIDAYHNHVGDKLVLQIRSGDFPEITDDIKQHLIDDTKLVSSLLEVLFLKGDSEKPHVFNLIQYITHQHRDHAYNSSSVWLPAFFKTPKCRQFLKRCEKLPILAEVIKQTDLSVLEILLSFCCHKPTLLHILDILESSQRQRFLRDYCGRLFLRSCYNECEDTVQCLLKQNSSLALCKYRKETTPLMIATEVGNLRIARMILDFTPDEEQNSYIEQKEDTGKSIFFVAAKHGHLKLLQYFRNRHKSKGKSQRELHTIVDNFGNTPLMHVALCNSLDIVSWLVSIDPDCMKTRNKNNKSVLHFAALNGNTEIASVLLESVNSSERSSLISSPDDKGLTAFHWSCLRGHLEFSKCLLEEYKNYKSESDPLLHTIRDNDGTTPLELAVASNHLEIVSWLVSIDPDCMKLQNKDKLSVLQVAAANGKTEIASVLLKSANSSDKSSLISSLDDEGMTAFHWSCSKGHLEFSKWLLEEYKNYKSESDPLLHTIQNNNGTTPFELAVLRNHLEIVSWLVSIDPDCTKTRSKNKKSILHFAALTGNTEIASVLLESLNSLDRSSLISSPDDKGMTALHWSCSEGHLEFSKCLLEEYKIYKSESDPLLHTIQNNNGTTPFELAVLRNHLEIVSWLVSIDPDCTKTRSKNKKSILHFAALTGNTEIASVLLESLNSLDRSSLISSPDDKGMTAFHWSCSKGHLEFSKWLLEEYKNYKSESDPLLHTIQNNNGTTPFELAVLRNHLEIVSWLVSIDPDCMKTRSKNKKSVLHFAALTGNTEIASVLLKSVNSSDKSSLISSPDDEGWTAFHWSCLRGHLEFSKFLLEEYKNYKSESDPLLHTIQNNNGTTPLVVAVLRNHLEIVGWLASIDLACMKLRNKDKLSVLHVAAANGKTEIASVLLKSVNSSDKSSLISSPDDEGMTAFHWSCLQGHLEFSKWLLEEYNNYKSESDPLLHTIRDNDGTTPLELGVVRNHLEIVGWLASIDLACMKLQNKDKLSVLHVAAANGKTEIASVLFKSVNSSERSSLILSPDDKGLTAFHWSCIEGHLEFSKWLLEEYNNYKSESDPLLHTIRDNVGATPLEHAVLGNHLEIVGWLASIDLACMKLQNKDKLSVLHVAAAN